MDSTTPSEGTVRGHKWSQLSVKTVGEHDDLDARAERDDSRARQQLKAGLIADEQATRQGSEVETSSRIDQSC